MFFVFAFAVGHLTFDIGHILYNKNVETYICHEPRARNRNRNRSTPLFFAFEFCSCFFFAFCSFSLHKHQPKRISVLPYCVTEGPKPVMPGTTLTLKACPLNYCWVVVVR